jgi:hypothetical protein
MRRRTLFTACLALGSIIGIIGLIGLIGIIGLIGLMGLIGPGADSGLTGDLPAVPP